MEKSDRAVSCLVDSCEKPHTALGLCRLHYQRQRHGRPLDLRKPSERERFWAKVDKGLETDCWNWTGTRNPNGHGRFSQGDKMVYAHRYAFEERFGEIAPGMVVDHKCRNRKCVNPSHLQEVTPAENAQNRGPNRSNPTGLRGVSWDKRSSRYIAQVRFQGKTHFAGYFERAEDAAQAAKHKRLDLYSNNVYDQ